MAFAIGAEWEPSVALHDQATNKGFSAETVNSEIENFRNYYRADGQRQQDRDER